MPKPSPADIAFDQSFKSSKRHVITNDFQLAILKRALDALAGQIDSEGRSIHTKEKVLTAAQMYEMQTLNDIISEIAGSPPDEKMTYGWIL